MANNIEDLVEKYFFKNFTYNDICRLLKKKHEISISLSTLKRIIQSLGLRRKNIKESYIEEICLCIIEELHDSGYNLGYRALYCKLKKKYFLTVKRDTVYEILQVIDPSGLENRLANRLRRRQYLSPGPNFVWHLDGYDKLKPYGFAIHGCIDGYSRYILWLEVASTNNDPKVIAYYFMKTVYKYECLPTIVRSDKGTENTLIESLQICLRKEHNDKFAGEASYIKGKSVHNQRIESFWGQLRHHSMDFYIQFFKCMVQKNLFDGSDIHKFCLQYSFGNLIVKDLYMTQELWNEHKIRKQVAQNNVNGKPYLLYNLPEKYGVIDYKKEIDKDTINELTETLTTKPQIVNSRFKENVNSTLFKEQSPSTPEEALDLYINLVNWCES